MYFSLYAQQLGNPEDDIKLVFHKIEENYPQLTNKKQKLAFEQYANTIIASNQKDTFWKLSKITNYFKDKHLQIYDTTFLQRINLEECNENLKNVVEYLSNEPKYQFEGYWINDYLSCIIGIKRDSTDPLVYNGYVIEAKNSILIPGMVCCKFERLGNSNYFYTDYINSLGKFRVYLTSIFRNDSIMTTGTFSKWKRIKNYTSSYLNNLSVYDRRASFQQLDNKFFLIRIPTNSRDNTQIVDSLIKLYKNQIEQSETLIIDIRNNGGGAVNTYYPLFPYIYTNPIATVGGKIYCSPEGLKDEQETLVNQEQYFPNDTAIIKIYKERVQNMKANMGSFISVKGDTITFDSIRTYPKNIAIIMNYACLSAAELMLLDFKQSKKVKLFGEATGGAVDYLDNYHLISPSKKYWLYIPNTVRITNTEQPQYDNTGIKPDVEISDSVADWIEYVKAYYKNNK